MIVAYEAESKERENLMLQIFILSYSHVYTHEKFIEVQAQFREKVSNSTFNKFVVIYDAILCEVKCQCLLFESRNVKRRCTHINSIQDEPLLESRSKRFDDLHNICEFVSESEELTGTLHRAFDNVMAEMQEYQAKNKGKCSS
ncbi:hypothetical protein Ahy_B06g084523 [Arachis hypogaea]|uniref:SWIM-type domain-containing protein n=1 Tax=Arachis hypogaea TaxID=3818 RepID=A0A444YS42_ARAHY|nr:hypothetical protein Ahy_B06g084523 [Arachis hypogaea]